METGVSDRPWPERILWAAILNPRKGMRLPSFTMLLPVWVMNLQASFCWRCEFSSGRIWSWCRRFYQLPVGTSKTCDLAGKRMAPISRWLKKNFRMVWDAVFFLATRTAIFCLKYETVFFKVWHRQKTSIARAKEDFPGKSRGQTPCPYGQVDHAYEKMTARRYFEAAAIGILSMDYEHHAGFRSRLIEEKET